MPIKWAFKRMAVLAILDGGQRKERPSTGHKPVLQPVPYWYYNAVQRMHLFLYFAMSAGPSQPAVRAELLAMERLDQAPFRAKLVSGLNASDWEAIKQMRVRHAARLAEIIAELGWPGASLVGKDGANAAWLIVQHADHDVIFQRRCLHLMEPLVNTGDVSKTDFAYLTDRVLVNEGRRQIYGTQTERGPDGRYRPMPVDDENNLDRRRKSVGLGSERKYLRSLQKLAETSSP